MRELYETAKDNKALAWVVGYLTWGIKGRRKQVCVYMSLGGMANEIMIYCLFDAFQDVEDEETVQEEGRINTEQPAEADATSQPSEAVDATSQPSEPADATSQPSEAADATVEIVHNSSSPDCLDGAGETNNKVQDSEGHSSLIMNEAVLDREEEYTEGQENCVEKEVIQGNDDKKQEEEWSARANEVSVDGLVHTMNEEEKAR